MGEVLEHWLPVECASSYPAMNRSHVQPSDPLLTGYVPGSMWSSPSQGKRQSSSLLNLLEKFVDGYANTGEQLLHELRTDQLEQTIRRGPLHKVDCRNIGGKELEAVAAELEKALREKGSVHFSLEKPVRRFIDRLMICWLPSRRPSSTADRDQTRPEGNGE